MDDLLREFLTESAENLDRLEQEIVLLEQRPDDKDLLGSIFRSMHTIKGTCGFLGLERLESVAHASENVLGALRDGTLAASDGETSSVRRVFTCPADGSFANTSSTSAIPFTPLSAACTSAGGRA